MRRLATILGRLRRARAGTAAIEFVLVLPIAIVTYLGMAEYTHYMAVKARVVQTALEIEDLIGRQQSFTATTFSTVCGLSKTLLAPIPLTGFQITVSAETVSSGGTTSIAWQVQSPVATSTTTALTCPKVTGPTVVALPASILALPQVSSNSIIIVTVSYAYSRVTRNTVLSYLPYSASLTNVAYTKIGYFRYASPGQLTY
jgi:Flp pilus assembly protein TadG